MPDTHDDGRVPLRQRSIPDQLDHFGDKLGGLLDRANLDRDMLIVIGAAVVNLGAIAAQLRKQAEQLAAATARAEKAERERDVWKSEAERRSAERNAAVRRIGLVRECLNAPGELLPGLAELLEDGTGRALSASETDADGSQGSADGSTPVRAAAALSEACGNKYGYHVCFLPAGHDGDHRDSLNWTWMTHLGTWPNDDDTTGADR